MLFASAQSYHRVCRDGRCWLIPVSSRLQGLGDTIDANDPCVANPSDPVCVSFYGSQQAANKASVTDGDPTAPTTSIGTDVSSAWNKFASWVGGGGAAISTALPGTTNAAPIHAASAKLFSVGGLFLLAALGGVGYGGYHLYKMHKRK